MPPVLVVPRPPLCFTAPPPLLPPPPTPPLSTPRSSTVFSAAPPSRTPRSNWISAPPVPASLTLAPPPAPPLAPPSPPADGSSLERLRVSTARPHQKCRGMAPALLLSRCGEATLVCSSEDWRSAAPRPPTARCAPGRLLTPGQDRGSTAPGPPEPPATWHQNLDPEEGGCVLEGGANCMSH